MARKWLTAALTAAVLLVAVAGWLAFRSTAARANVESQAPQPPFQTEQEWIVWQIMRTIAAGAAAVRGEEDAPAPPVVIRTRAAGPLDLLNTATLDVEVAAAPAGVVRVTEHVWSPEAYVELARSLVEALPRPATVGAGVAVVAGGPAPGRRSQLETLTDPRVEVLLAEEARISAALKVNPPDGGAHEEAALLTATLALREMGGWFADLRPLLCRTTSHLALARALAGGREPGPSGRVAAAVVDVLVGREDLAFAELDRWSTAGLPAAAAVWNRVLRLRATGDWRRVEVTPSGPLLERLEYARALRNRVGPSRFLQFLDEQADHEPVADWHRIALHDEWTGFTIEAGHRFAEEGLVLELGEIAAVWRRYHQGEPTIDSLVASMDAPWPASYRAIDWTTWAGFLERHVCAQLAATARRLAGLGLDYEKEGWLETAAPFRPLRLFPLVPMKIASNDRQYEAALAVARKTAEAYPELVTSRLSQVLRSRPYFRERAETFPSDTAWFTPHVPTGTTFELASRTLSEGCPRPVPVPQVERWASQAPHDMWLLYSLAFLRSDSVPELALGRRLLSNVIEYDIRASRRVFRYMKGTSDDYLAVARIMCRLDSDDCDKLAAELLWNGREAQASSVYDAYARNARDSVAVSNNIGWLVRYLWDTGKLEHAEGLAERARDVGSAQGLATYGELLDRQGREDEARAVFERIVERYESSHALASHYLRRAARTGDSQWVQRASKALPELFPDGIQPVEGAWLSAPPPDGVTFASYGPRAARTGLKEDDIIVAVDGYRVHSVEQYQVVMRGGFAADVPMRVWRQGRYQGVRATIPQRWMGVTLVTHPSAVERRVRGK